MLSKLALFLLASAAAASATACSTASSDASVETEDDVKSAARLEPAASAPELETALAEAAETSGTKLEVASFTYDAGRTKDPAKVIAAVRAKLAHPRLRVDEGPADAAVLDATLDEYGVTEAPHKAGIAKALRGMVGEAPSSRKLWLRSDDVAGADSEWAEVVLIYVVPAKSLVVRLTIRYDA